MKLEKLRMKNAKDYWKLLKSTVVKPQNRCDKLNSRSFADYFK